MGFRTVVVLNNDQSHEWENDPELGKKIWRGSWNLGRPLTADCFQYGQIVEQIHADVQTLAVLDGYGASLVARTHWNRNQTEEDRNLELLKSLAEKMGYRISKKPNKK